MYVERAGTSEERDLLVQKFIQRQEAIEVDNQDFPPISIFAEATTTNGTRILPFKRGAFQGMRTVTPCFFKFSQSHLPPTYEIIELVPFLVLLLTSLALRRASLTIMPEFTPTPYMLEKHADKGKEPWAIYAWCVRDTISKASGIPVLDEKLDLKDKLAFYALMNDRADRVEINGQIFEYENDTPVQDVRISSRALIRRKSTITYKLAEDAKEG